MVPFSEKRASPKPPRKMAAQKRRARLASRYGWRSRQPNCERCGVAMTIASTGRVRRFCSYKCQRGGTARSCELCPREILTGRFCRYCTRKLKHRTQRACPQCRVLFWPVSPDAPRRQKYCSNECRLIADRADATLALTCDQCGVRFERLKGWALRRTFKPKHSFCSRECARKYHTGANHALYRGDKDPNRGAEWNKLAESIRRRDGHLCQRCTKTQQDNGERLSVDHIVPWRQFTDKAEANQPTNLISLCRRCHSIKTTAYERLWLKGDRIGMEQYRKAIQLPPLFASVQESR